VAKVVVTGGLGFIGSHVADAYLARGDEVVVIDSTVASVIDGSELEVHPNCTVLRVSVEDYFARGGTLEGVDRVIHAAALVGPAGILKYAGTIGPRIVQSTAAVLDACIAHDVPVATFSSA
jgi:nucleoside-diphosphate-sugar epimerase